MNFINQLKDYLVKNHAPLDWLYQIRQYCEGLEQENEFIWREHTESQSQNKRLWEENKRLKKEKQELEEVIMIHIDREVAHMKTAVKSITRNIEPLDG
jgi:predicted nuclease with TOPRIM domain